MALRDYIGEATAHDRKIQLERKDPSSWLKSVSAFANTDGGKLLFGVADDGSPVGLADAQGDAEAISEAGRRVGRRVPSPPADGMCLRENGTCGAIVLGKNRHPHRSATFQWNPLHRRAGTARPTHPKPGKNTSFSLCNPTINGIESSSTNTEAGTPDKGAVDTITKTDTKTDTKTISKEAKEILKILAGNRHVSAERLGQMVGLSVSGVRYHLRALTKESLIRRIGSSKTGYWEVVK